MFEVDFSRCYASLQYMWQGMLCIFAVTAVLIGTVYLLNKLGSRKKKNDSQNNQ